MFMNKMAKLPKALRAVLFASVVVPPEPKTPCEPYQTSFWEFHQQICSFRDKCSVLRVFSKSWSNLARAGTSLAETRADVDAWMNGLYSEFKQCLATRYIYIKKKD